VTRFTDELPELAPLVQATRDAYLQPPPPAVRERHVAMIVAESRRVAAAGAVTAPARGFRLGWRRFGLAVALAAAVVVVLLVGDADNRPAPRVSDPPSPAPLSDRAGSPQERLGTGEPERAPDTRSAPAPSLPEPNAAPEPGALAERPQPQPEADPAPPPRRSYGGPEASPAPLKGPLDTEPPIPTAPESGGPAPDAPPP
jgi:hypothetical protein